MQGEVIIFSSDEEAEEEELKEVTGQSFKSANPDGDIDRSKIVKDALIKFKLKDKDLFPADIFEQEHVGDVYDFEEKLGEGGFGKVYRARHKKSNIVRAIKEIRIKGMKDM